MSEHWLLSMLRDLEDRKFFGSVTLKFRNGRVVLIEEQRTILPPEEKNSKENVSGQAQVAVRS